MSEISDIELLKELGQDLDAPKPKKYSAIESRLIAGFEDIVTFYEENERAPRHGEGNDIFERLYAVRLDRLRENELAQELLGEIDKYGLLTLAVMASNELLDDELLSELGIDLSTKDEVDITNLQHVSPVAHRRAAEEVAAREVCRDFDHFEAIFDDVRLDLKTGARIIRDSATQEDFDIGSLFILNGQIAYIAEKGEEFKATGKNRADARLRVIYDNGTESNLLMRSLQRALNADDNGRTISSPEAGPLFDDNRSDEDETGTIYVLMTLSDLPEIAPIKDAILKIGVTGGDVKKRVANAKLEPTYLLGDVKIVEEFKLYNINRQRLERMLHGIFADARLQLSIKDRFGNPFVPREWFMTTRAAVAEAVELIRSGDIKNYKYDVKNAKFIKA